MGRTKSYYDVRDALAQAGCAVCRLKAEATLQFLESLLWENVNDPKLRQDIRQARGFCRAHTWALARPDSSLGVAIITRDVLQNVLRILDVAKFQAPPALSLRRTQEALNPGQPAAATAELVAQLAPQEACPVCVKAQTMETIYLNTLVENLVGEDGLLTIYQASDGLCLPHFRQALTRVRDEALFEAMVNAQRAIWERLVAHLGETIRKSNYRFREEPPGEESGAWLRAIGAVAGAREM